LCKPARGYQREKTKLGRKRGRKVITRRTLETVHQVKDVLDLISSEKKSSGEGREDHLQNAHDPKGS